MKLQFGFLLILLCLGLTSGMAQSKSARRNDACHRWRTQVDPSKERIVIDESKLTDNDVNEGIRCLLALKGLKSRARFYGDTRANYNKSEAFRPQKKATIEIAALYYVSYLFENNWEHADAVVLVDDATGKTNSQKVVEKAYKSYEEWFKQVRDVGLTKARELKLDPLAGSGVGWL